MTMTNPWSVKGVEPRTREAAKDLARREGLTLGEWLNRLVSDLEDETVMPDAAEARSQPPAYASSAFTSAPAPDETDYYQLPPRPQRDVETIRAARETEIAALTTAVEQLSKRIEETEHRSSRTLATVQESVSALDRKVAGAGQVDPDTLDRLDGIVRELLASQSVLTERLNQLQDGGSNSKSIVALRALEGALTRLATQVYANEDRAEATLGAIEAKLLAAQARTDASLAEIRTTVEERLSAAPAEPASLGAIEARLAELESVRPDEAIAAMKEAFEERMEAFSTSIDGLLSRARQDITAAVTGQVDRQIAEAAAELSARLDESEARNNEALERIGTEVARAAEALDGRLRSLEAHGNGEAFAAMQAEFTEISRSVDARLTLIERREAEAMQRVSDEVQSLSQRLNDRVNQSEERSAKAIEMVGDQMVKLAETLQDRQEQAVATLADRLREADERAAQRMAEELARADLRAREMTAPIERTMDRLGERVGRLEGGTVRPQAETVVMAAPSASFEPVAMTATLPAAAATAFTAPAIAEPVAAEPVFEMPVFEDDKPDGAAETAPAMDFVSDDLDAALDDIVEAAPEEEAVDTEALTDWAQFDDAEREAEPGEVAATDDTFGSPIFEDPFKDETDQELAMAASERALDEDMFESDDNKDFEQSPFATPLPDSAEADPFTGGFGETSPPRKSGRPDYLETARKAAEAAMAADAMRAEAKKQRKSTTALSANIGRPGVMTMALAGVVGAGVLGAGYVMLRPKEATAPSAVVGAQAVAPPAAVAAAPAEVVIPPTPPAEAAATQEAASPRPAAPSPAPAVAPPASSARPAPAPVTPAPKAAAPRPATTTAADTPRPTPARTTAARPTQPAPARTPAPTFQRTPNATAAPAAPAPTSATRPVAPVLTAPPPTSAEGQYALAQQRMQAGDRAGAAAAMLKAAEGGIVPAQVQVARMFERGEGVPADLAKAREWTTKAANAGDRQAMHNLAVFFANGDGGPKDFGEAAKWFRSAAQRGVADSQYNLGALSEQGLGVPKDAAEAFYWYSLAAKQGDADAAQRASQLEAGLTPTARTAAKARVDGFRPL